MWWERWIPKSYLSKSTVCGVECFFSENEISFNYSIITIKKNKVEFVIKGNTTSNSDEILKIAKKNNAPIVLNITGKVVISNYIILGESENYEIETLIKNYLPTINPNDFYIQFFKNKNNSGFLSICRKEQADLIIAQFTNQKQVPVNLFIGPLALNSLSSLTKQLNFIYSNNYQFELTDGYIQNINYSANNSSNKIDNLEIASNEIIPFASAFSYLTRQPVYSSNNKEVTSLLENHQQKLKLNVLIFAFIAIVFVISAINSVVFFNIFEEHSQLEVELNLYESKNAQITQLLESYQKKKNLIEQAGIFENKKLSIFADKIGSTLPNEIVLKEMYFNPEIGETEEDSLVNYNKNQLQIKGNCNKSQLLNEWINVLKNQNFIKSVNLQNFIYNSESHLPNFTIEIELN